MEIAESARVSIARFKHIKFWTFWTLKAAFEIRLECAGYWGVTSSLNKEKNSWTHCGPDRKGDLGHILRLNSLLRIALEERSQDQGRSRWSGQSGHGLTTFFATKNYTSLAPAHFLDASAASAGRTTFQKPTTALKIRNAVGGRVQCFWTGYWRMRREYWLLKVLKVSAQDRFIVSKKKTSPWRQNTTVCVHKWLLTGLALQRVHYIW